MKVEKKLLEDFDLLLLTGRQTRGACGQIDPEWHLCEEFIETAFLAFPVENKRVVGSRSDEVLGDRHVRYEGKMLIDHPEAQRMSLPRIIDLMDSSIDPYVTRIGVVIAH